MNLSHSRFCRFLILACLGAAFVGVAAGEPASYQLAATAQVDAEGVFLNQLVQADTALPVLRLCDAPAFGKTFVLTRAQAADLARAAGADASATNWTGAESIRISRRSRNFVESDALALLTATLQKEYAKDRGDLELRFTHPWTSLAIPDEPITAKILDVPTLGITQSFIVRFELHTAHETLGVWQAPVEARIWREVWVASSALKMGDPLDPANVSRERSNIINLHDAPADFPPGDATLEIAGSVPAGSPLLSRFVKARPVVYRGQAIDGVMQEGALSITLRVELLEDGAPGQIVHVRNPASKRDIRGKVLNDQTILILL